MFLKTCTSRAYIYTQAYTYFDDNKYSLCMPYTEPAPVDQIYVYTYLHSCTFSYMYVNAAQTYVHSTCGIHANVCVLVVVFLVSCGWSIGLKYTHNDKKKQENFIFFALSSHVLFFYALYGAC